MACERDSSVGMSGMAEAQASSALCGEESAEAAGSVLPHTVPQLAHQAVAFHELLPLRAMLQYPMVYSGPTVDQASQRQKGLLYCR